MSLTPEGFIAADKRLKVIRAKLYAVGKHYSIDYNHWGVPMLYGQEVYEDMPVEKIIEINDLYEKLYREIKDIFEKNRYVLKDDYFQYDRMSQELKFLGLWVDVYKGIEPLLPAINDFILMNNRTKVITDKYGTEIDQRFFCPWYTPDDTEFKWDFYGEIVTAKTSDAELEKIFAEFYQFNLRVNHLLKVTNFQRRNQVWPLGHYYKSRPNEWYFSLFTVRFISEAPDAEILETINAAQLLESRIKQITEELKIHTKYKLEYAYGYTNNIGWSCSIWLRFNGYGISLSLNSSYDKIKDMIQREKNSGYIR